MESGFLIVALHPVNQEISEFALSCWWLSLQKKKNKQTHVQCVGDGV
jgi:hypothetical protein